MWCGELESGGRAERVCDVSQFYRNVLAVQSGFVRVGGAWIVGLTGVRGQLLTRPSGVMYG